MKTPSICLTIIAFLFYLVAARAGAETIVFQDTFNAPDSENVSADLDTRQAGGEAISDYKKAGGKPNQSAIISNQFKRIGPGSLTTTTNFADRVAGKSFALSVDIKLISTGGGWGSISLLSDTGSNRGTTPLSILLTPSVVIVSSGLAGEPPAGTRTTFSPTQLSRLLGVTFKTSDFHQYKYVVTEANSVSTASFFIDGVELPLKNATIVFGDETGRRINFVNNSPEGYPPVEIVFDNLKLTVISPH